ncbi:MAG: hypothetical protein AB1641_08800 [Thermodesulfobacteriota bacterium]
MVGKTAQLYGLTMRFSLTPSDHEERFQRDHWFPEGRMDGPFHDLIAGLIGKEEEKVLGWNYSGVPKGI